MNNRSTPQAALEIATTSWALLQAINQGRVTAPARSPHGFYLWTDEDIERARRQMAIDRRRREYRQPRPQRQATAAGPAEFRGAAI
jgi:hypothetical protein